MEDGAHRRTAPGLVRASPCVTRVVEGLGPGGVGVDWGDPAAPPRPSGECGIVAQIAGPLAAADISAYYISTFNFDHALVSPLTGEGPGGRGGGPWGRGRGRQLACLPVPAGRRCPEDGIGSVIEVLQRRQDGLGS